MNKHLMIEAVLGGVIAVGAGWSFHQQALDAAKVQAKVEGRADQQKQDNETLQEIKKRWDESNAVYENKLNSLQHMKPQQIVTKVPEYVSGIPSSSRPITIWGPNVAAPSEGDAIVPADQIKPIAAQILAGNKCMVNDLPSCVKERDIWIHKYNLRDQDAKDWEKLAKGSQFGRKLKRCGILAGAGFAVGYAPNDPNRGRNGLIGAGVIGIPCMFLK